MAATQIDEQRVARHSAQLAEMDTQALVNLWANSEDADWTPEGIEAIKSLLRERAGFVPEKRVGSHLLIHPDTYHDHDKIIGLALRLTSLSWLFLLLAALALIPVVLAAQAWGSGAIAGAAFEDWLRFFGPSLVSALQSGLISIALFLAVRAASEVVLVLMDIEQNTRPQQITPTSSTQ